MEGFTLSYVDDLTPKKDLWNMRARIIRLWRQSYRLDMILIDEKGKKIQACVKNHLVPDFEAFLKEDVAVLIKKFGVGASDDRYKVIPLEHKVNFFKCTELKLINGFQGHPYGFNFIPFSVILSNNDAIRRALTVDVIGRVAWSGDLDVYKSPTKESRKLNLDLQDYEGNVLRCTFWDNYAEMCNKYIASYSGNEMILIIIQHGKIKSWNGNITIQNDKFGTRIFLNEEIEEANNLRRRLILRDGPSVSHSVLSSQTVYPLRDEFLVKHDRKHVDEIREITEECTFVVFGTIMMLEQEFGWFYKACRNCHRKALTKSEFLEVSKELPPNFIDAPFDSLWCVKCVTMATNLIPKFKVQFRVQDSTGSVSLVMFDKDVSKLVGLSAVDIREPQMKAGDMATYPRELDVLMNKKFAFKVIVSDYNLKKNYRVYTVLKYCDDPDVLGELGPSENNEEVTEDQPEQSEVKLSESSQAGIDSKDAFSVTGESLAVDMEKDSGTSPVAKRVPPVSHEEPNNDQASTSKRIRHKKIPYDV